MAIFLHILPNMENVTFKSLGKTTLDLNVKNLETTFYSSFLICQWKCNFHHF